MNRQQDSPAEPFSVTMTLEARPENAAVARRAVAEQATRAGLADRITADAKVVVTEGFTNAARHAYPDPTFEQVLVEARADDRGITIVVRDTGEGFRPRIPERERASGFGLGLIAALADRVELRRLAEGGTEVRARLEGSADEPLH